MKIGTLKAEIKIDTSQFQRDLATILKMLEYIKEEEKQEKQIKIELKHISDKLELKRISDKLGINNEDLLNDYIKLSQKLKETLESIENSE